MENNNIIYICEDCGNISIRGQRTDGYVHPCILCDSKKLYKIPIQFNEYKKMKKIHEWDNYILSLFPNQSQTWKLNLQLAQKNQDEFRSQNLPLKNNLNIPKCPICNSVNLSKITNTKKVVKIMAFGIFGMGDNGKTWKCNNCGSKF